MSFHEIRYTAQKIAQRLGLIEPLVYRRKHTLEPFRWKRLEHPSQQPTAELMADADQWPVIPSRTYWGEPDTNFLMQSMFKVPSEFITGNAIGLFLPLGDAASFSHPEALVYIDGQSYATVDRHHQEIQLEPSHCDGQTHTLWLHGWTGIEEGGFNTYKQLLMQNCFMVEIDGPTRRLTILTRVALMAANLLDSTHPAKDQLLNVLDMTFNVLDTREPFGDAFYGSVPRAVDILQQGIATAGQPLGADLYAAGHAHIDVAWLWTLAQTAQKAGRTFHTALRLMEQFSDYHFTQSQPQLYAYMEEHYPHVLDAIKERVAEGRWEPIGGMWVEADCNISGSESLARQFLLGRTYFREQFGPEAESPVLWLPDVFGYAWNLPQLIKLAGLDYFFTIKIGWNQYNEMPYDSFWWQGLDGTKVLTHFSTTPEHPWSGPVTIAGLANHATYNANLDAFTVLGSWAKLKHKEAQKVLLMSYGWGDGGGGPTREMNENAQVLRNFPALPRVKQGKVIDFFRRLADESGDRLPTWNSELYLEIHRGTYTTQSRNKRANRKSEFALHDAEFLASFATVLDSAYVYPHETLRKAWELVCLNQFHDIIPGSSIHRVYEDSLAQYKTVAQLATAVREDALAVIKDYLGGDIVIVNPTSFYRYDTIFLEGEAPAGKRLMRDDYSVVVQPTAGGLLASVGEIAPNSVICLTWEVGELHVVTEREVWATPDRLERDIWATPDRLENGWLRVELNQNGDIIRIYDKHREREVLPQGAIANQWQAFEDRPLNWDAWDIDIFYDDKLFLAEPAESITVIENGPLRATIEIKRRILNSSYVQRISLQRDSRRLDFHTEIDWCERHVLLKAAFPVDILSPVATYEVQWGHVQRPTHRNTSWDWARFETVAQKWVDLSESNYGVALLNDCKYGHDIHDNVIRISLLRAPTMPDPEADQGVHQFSYSLLPHGDPYRLGIDYFEILSEAYALNDPLLVTTGSSVKRLSEQTLLSVSDGVVIETIKRAEDGNGVIVRLYEPTRDRRQATFNTSFPLSEVYITNLLEDNETSLVLEDQTSFYLELKPFQIVTLRLVFV